MRTIRESKPIDKNSSYRCVVADPAIRDIIESGRTRLLSSFQLIPLHVHDQKRFEIIYVENGQYFESLNNRQFIIPKNDGIVIAPGQKHGQSNPGQLPFTASYLVLDVSPEKPNFLILNGIQARHLRNEMLALENRPFPFSDLAADLWLTTHEALRRGPRDPLNIHVNLTAFLLEMVTCSRRHSSTKDTRPTPLAELVVSHIDSNLDHRIPLRALAELCRMSPSFFINRFEKETGLSPMEFVARRKIHHALNKLEHSSDSVTTIALDLGFSDSQHLAKVFRNLTNMSPSEYRRNPNPRKAHPHHQIQPM